MEHPKTTSHNCEPLVEAFIARYHLQPGDAKLITIFHDYWCDIFTDAWCNCQPSINFGPITVFQEGDLQ